MSTTTGPWVLKKMVNILFLERKPVFRTSGRGSSSTSHTMLERLSFIVKKEIQHSSPVTTSENLWGPFGSNYWNQLRQIATLCSFCSVVNRWGTHLAQFLDRPNCSWKIESKCYRWVLYYQFFGSLPELSVTDVRGLPARASSSTLSLPSLKSSIHLVTTQKEDERSP